MQKLENIKNHRETQQKTKRPKRSRQKLSKTIEKTKAKHNKNKTLGPMSTLGDIGPTVLFVLVLLVFSRVFDSCCLDLLGYFGFFGFPGGC